MNMDKIVVSDENITLEIRNAAAINEKKNCYLKNLLNDVIKYSNNV